MKLKLCPFDNKIAIVIQDDSCFRNMQFEGDETPNHNNTGYQTRCQFCGGRTTWYHTKEKAIEAWDRRSNDPLRTRQA